MDIPTLVHIIPVLPLPTRSKLLHITTLLLLPTRSKLLYTWVWLDLFLACSLEARMFRHSPFRLQEPVL